MAELSKSPPAPQLSRLRRQLLGGASHAAIVTSWRSRAPIAGYVEV